MSDLKFTPGPWLIEDERDGTFSVWTRQPHTGTLATVHEEDINGAYPAKANAQLMSVAPELLADLIVAASTLRRYEQSHRAKGTEERTAKAEVNADLATRFEATIRKATAPPQANPGPLLNSGQSRCISGSSEACT